VVGGQASGRHWAGFQRVFRDALLGCHQGQGAGRVAADRHGGGHAVPQGRPVQVDPIKPLLKPPGTRALDPRTRVTNTFANTGNEYGKYSLITRPDYPEYGPHSSLTRLNTREFEAQAGTKRLKRKCELLLSTSALNSICAATPRRRGRTSVSSSSWFAWGAGAGCGCWARAPGTRSRRGPSCRAGTRSMREPLTLSTLS